MTVATAGRAGVPVAMWSAIADLVRRWSLAEFSIPGQPVSWERTARFEGRSLTPKQVRIGEKEVATRFREANPDWQVDYDTVFGVYIKFRVKTLGTKDADNMVKLVLDGLNKVAWGDDAQVDDLLVRVERGVADPGTVVVLYPAAGNRLRQRRARRASAEISPTVRRLIFNTIAAGLVAGRRPNLTQLAAASGLTVPAVGAVVRSLEADGYLSRAASGPTRFTIHKPFPREIIT